MRFRSALARLWSAATSAQQWIIDVSRRPDDSFHSTKIGFPEVHVYVVNEFFKGSYPDLFVEARI
jgi:hypothetical protein